MAALWVAGLAMPVALVRLPREQCLLLQRDLILRNPHQKTTEQIKQTIQRHLSCLDKKLKASAFRSHLRLHNGRRQLNFLCRQTAKSFVKIKFTLIGPLPQLLHQDVKCKQQERIHLISKKPTDSPHHQQSTHRPMVVHKKWVKMERDRNDFIERSVQLIL